MLGPVKATGPGCQSLSQAQTGLGADGRQEKSAAPSRRANKRGGESTPNLPRVVQQRSVAYRDWASPNVSTVSPAETFVSHLNAMQPTSWLPGPPVHWMRRMGEAHGQVCDLSLFCAIDSFDELTTNRRGTLPYQNSCCSGQ